MIAVVLGGITFAIVLAVQLGVARYAAPVYWTAVVMVTVFGTMCADVIHVRFGVPYAASAAMFSVALVVVFLTWYRVEGTLSIHSITTTRRELFYWAAVLTTFALGTTVGDLTAYTLHLGFFSAGLLFVGVFAVPRSRTGSAGSAASPPSGRRTSSPGHWAHRSPTGWVSPGASAASTGGGGRSPSPSPR